MFGGSAAASGLPLVVCVSPDPAVRERFAIQFAGQIDDRGVMMMCTDLDALREVLWPAGPAPVAADTGELVVDERSRQVFVDGHPLPLTRIECALVGHLASAPVRVWTYERLFTAVWGGTYLGDNAILHSAVKRLRRKLRTAGGRVEVETVRGVGYRLVAFKHDSDFEADSDRIAGQVE
jgi:two-component system, OmpR family, response regulator MtrA